MVSRRSLYRRWRRFQVIGLAYPILTCLMHLLIIYVICWASLA